MHNKALNQISGSGNDRCLKTIDPCMQEEELIYTYLAEAVEQSLEEQGDDDDDGTHGGDDPRGRVLQRYLLRAAAATTGFGAAASGHDSRLSKPSSDPLAEVAAGPALD